MFLPTTNAEVKRLGWDGLDIILVTGDAYIDSPFMGVALLGKFLVHKGYRVGIIPQPDTQSRKDITSLGQPRLFWGVTGGAVDSMVANYTASGRKRRSDDYTPGGKNTRRPDRAVIVYSNLIRKHFKQTAPIVLGGIEASLRRVAHYDFWSNRIRKSILFDAKADYLIYGMGERAILELAERLRDSKSVDNIRGICRVGSDIPESYIELPSFEKVASNDKAFISMFGQFYLNNDPISAKGLAQKQDSRYLIQNKPAQILTSSELDEIYGLDFERDLHPRLAKTGSVKALETIRFSIALHRGCYGECNFCAIAVHEGRTIQSRSENSILKEADELIARHDFKGYINDVGGPTANMYGFECDRKLTRGACPRKRCVYPRVCEELPVDHGRQVSLLKRLRAKKGIKKVFVASGVRYDMLAPDRHNGLKYLQDLARYHVSGQLKVAPEHIDPSVLKLMGKPPTEELDIFRSEFYRWSKKAGKKQFLSYYFIAAHPGCTEAHMKGLKEYTKKELKLNPEQVQLFTPLPSTWSAVMYRTGVDPFTRRKIFVERSEGGRNQQKRVLQSDVRTGRKSRGRRKINR